MFFNPAELTPPATSATLRLFVEPRPAEMSKFAEFAKTTPPATLRSSGDAGPPKSRKVAEVAEALTAESDIAEMGQVAESQKSQPLTVAGALTPDDLAIAHALLRHWQEDDLTTGNEWLDGLARDPERLAGMRQMALAAGVARYAPAPAPTTEPEAEPRPMAVCARCRHWTPDTINPPGGLGRCLIDAPASRRPGSCWPWTHAGAGIYCNNFEETAHE